MPSEVGRGEAATMICRLTARAAARSGLIWGLVFGAIVASSSFGFISTYPTAAARAHVGLTLGANAGLRVLFGPARAVGTVGGWTAWRSVALVTLIGAPWAMLTATRLLRGQEDKGRWEVLLVGQTTRRRAAAQGIAGLLAGLFAAWAVTAVISVGQGTARSVHIAASAALFLTVAMLAAPAMFLAIGVLAAQLAPTRRQANGLAGAVFGAALAVRIVADSAHGLAWLRWASPLGWVEELRPLTGTRPWALAAVALLIGSALTAAVVLAGRRDLGASALPDRAVSRAHTRLLTGPVGLTVRLTRPLAIGWLAGLATFGLLFGLVARSAASSLANSQSLQKDIARLGGRTEGADAYIGLSFLFVAALVTFIAAGQLAATREEEAAGYVDNLLVRPVGRRRWLAGRLAVITALVVLVSLAAGLATWVGAAAQNSGVGIGDMLAASVNVMAPAVLLIGLVTVVYGTLPRLTAPAAYGLVAWSFVVELVGELLKANHWLLDTSLFLHIRPAPAAPPNWTSLAGLTATGIAAAAVGIWLFSRRDLATA